MFAALSCAFASVTIPPCFCATLCDSPHCKNIFAKHQHIWRAEHEVHFDPLNPAMVELYFRGEGQEGGADANVHHHRYDQGRSLTASGDDSTAASTAAGIGETIAVYQGGNTPGLHLLLGKTYLDPREAPQAVKEFKKAMVTEPRLPYPHYGLGMAYESLGEMNRAASQFEEEIVYHPNEPWSYQQRGLVALKIGQTDIAIKMFHKTLKRDTKASLSWVGLGQA